MNEVLDLLKMIPFGDIGFSGLVILAIVLIFRGDIVPKSSLEKMLADRDTIIVSVKEQNEMLKEAYSMSEKARLVEADVNKESLELGRTTVRLLRSIHDKANEERI